MPMSLSSPYCERKISEPYSKRATPLFHSLWAAPNRSCNSATARLAMRERKALSCPLNIKQVREDGRFAGYASVFGIVDNQRDIVLPGAFQASIAERASEIKLLWQHQPDEPIGYFTVLFEDEQGLYVEGQLMLELERGREAHALLKQGVVKGLSIGYSPVRTRLDPDSGVRQLLAVDLWEISLVTFPANAAAGVTVVKSAEADDWQAMDAAIRRLLTLSSSSPESRQRF